MTPSKGRFFSSASSGKASSTSRMKSLLSSVLRRPGVFSLNGSEEGGAASGGAVS